jgi:hypothetical protein
VYDFKNLTYKKENMVWRFRKRVKIIPGIYLNFSKKGISTTIGPRGFSVNIRPGAAYLNSGIPGTGISSRHSLHTNNKPIENNLVPQLVPDNQVDDKLSDILERYYDGSEEIKSEAIGHLTSSGLQSMKKAIMVAHKEYAEISGLLSDRSRKKVLLDKRLVGLDRSLFKFLFKKRIARFSFEQEELGGEIAELEEQKKLSTVELNVKNDETFGLLYRDLEKAYQLIIGCSRIWDITTSKDINRVQQRSFASTEIRRVEVRATCEESGLIESESAPLKILNKNGGDLFFYPGFILVHESHLEFAILDYSELDIEFFDTRFVETETVPADSNVIGSTWAKANKNGTPDKRFRDNYQIPLTMYGQMNFLSKTGLKESYLFSNQKNTRSFYSALKEYIDAIKLSNNLLKQFNNK